MKRLRYKTTVQLKGENPRLLEYEILEDIQIFCTDDLWKLEFLRWEGDKAIFHAYWNDRPYGTTELEVRNDD